MSAPIALQLYTLRDEVEALGMRSVLERVAAIGFAGVETAGFGDLAPADFASACRDLDLELASAHAMLGGPEESASTLDTFASLGFPRIVIPYGPPDEFTSVDSVKALADKLSAWAAAAAERGLGLGYHNHFWELADLDGAPALTRLYEHASDDVFAEVDIYWTTVGGVDPAHLLGGLGSRVKLLHIKDGPATAPEAAMTAVGAGVVDVPAAVAAAPQATWHFVELDRCESDMLEAVEQSYDYLVGRGLSTARR